MSRAPRIFYSASRGGFFDEAIHPDRPSDAVIITRARHAELLAAQASGAEIVAGKGGKPVSSAPATSIDAQRASAIGMIKREASRRILAIAPIWSQINDCAAIAIEALAGASPEVDAALDRRAAIDALRVRSNLLEQRVASMTGAQLAAFRPADDANWIAE